MLLVRLFESLPLSCPNCGADMRIVAFVTEAASTDCPCPRTTRLGR